MRINLSQYVARLLRQVPSTLLRACPALDAGVTWREGSLCGELVMQRSLSTGMTGGRGDHLVVPDSDPVPTGHGWSSPAAMGPLDVDVRPAKPHHGPRIGVRGDVLGECGETLGSGPLDAHYTVTGVNGDDGPRYAGGQPATQEQGGVRHLLVRHVAFHRRPV